MTGLADLLAKIEAQGGAEFDGTPSPVVALEDFFEGNDDLGSIGCNLGEDHPGIDRFFAVLKAVRQRDGVQDVLVEIYEVMAEGEWPFAERVYVLTTAEPGAVEEWLAPLEPSEIEEGWSGGVPAAAPALQDGVRVLAAWWD